MRAFPGMAKLEAATVEIKIMIAAAKALADALRIDKGGA